jgi:hypothetical protein
MFAVLTFLTSVKDKKNLEFRKKGSHFKSKYCICKHSSLFVFNFTVSDEDSRFYNLDTMFNVWVLQKPFKNYLRVTEQKLVKILTTWSRLATSAIFICEWVTNTVIILVRVQQHRYLIQQCA